MDTDAQCFGKRFLGQSGETAQRDDVSSAINLPLHQPGANASADAAREVGGGEFAVGHGRRLDSFIQLFEHPLLDFG